MTRIGIISAFPDDDWHAQRIAEAAVRRGAVRLLQPTDFAAVIDSGDGSPRLTVCGADPAAFDVFLTPRALGDRGDGELQLELYYTLADEGALLVNDVRALVRAIDKFRSSWLFARALVPTPRVVVAQGLDEAARALAEMRDVVVKPIYGSLGIGVERLGEADAARLTELLQRHRALYLQTYVEAELDVRAFVVGERVEAAIARRPRPGDFRSNIHQGAGAFSIQLDPQVCDAAVRASRAVGLDYSGVDLLVTGSGPLVLEVNGTPAFRAVNETTGRDMAEAIVEHALARAHRQEGANVPKGKRRHDREGGRPPWRSARRQARRRSHARPLRA